MRILLSAVLLAVVLFIPAKNLPQTANVPAGGDSGAAITDGFEFPDSVITYQDEMLMPPDCACDPEMMIWVTPDNDPGFMMEPGS
jgi:hypothetical protein